MDKRYQIFISSTYLDLKYERSIVIENLLKLGCFPAGMELFPSANDEQFEYIKQIIDDSDYYILIIGGKYGSTDDSGISFTEREFDYADKNKIPIMSFIHASPNELPAKYYELDSVKREKLEFFKTKVQKNRLVHFWENADQLASKVTVSLHDAFTRYPRQGWQKLLLNKDELQKRINELTEQNNSLKEIINDLTKRISKSHKEEYLTIYGKQISVDIIKGIINDYLPSSPMSAIKKFKDISGLSLKDSKDVIDYLREYGFDDLYRRFK